MDDAIDLVWMNLVCLVGCAMAAGDFTTRLGLSGWRLGLTGGAYF
jgi:hypothetical protein